MPRTARIIVLAALAALSLASCIKKARPGAPVETPSLITAFTSGVISRESPIRVCFAERIADSATINVPIAEPPISFKPRIEGTAVWSDDRTLEFRPKERLPQGQEHSATVKLAGLVPEEKGPAEFTFAFAAMKQYFDVEVEGLRAASAKDLTRQQLLGTVNTADVEDAAPVEQVLSVSQDGKALTVRWTHNEDRRGHAFVVDSIVRGEQESSVVVTWDGKPLGVDKKGDQQITVPALGAFNVTQVRAVQGAEEYVEVAFTDPLTTGQDLRGLIRIGGRSGLRYTIDGSVVRVYSGEPWTGSVTVRVETGVTNVMGRRLARGAEQSVTFQELKPQVRFVGTGVIIPTSQNQTVPIEAVNLRAIRVEALAVYERNMAQFLQVNALDGVAELHRVGRTVWKKTVPLDLPPNKVNTWVRYGLDLSPLLQDHRNGLYRLKLTFIREDIVYHCAATDTGETRPEAEGSEDADEQSEGSYWDWYSSGYDWDDLYSNRENPCHPAYYRSFGGHDITVSRNVLISDIGMIVKRGSDDTVVAALTDIRTAKPIAGASVSLLDYQQTVLAEGKTDRDGFVRLGGPRPGFVVIAESNGQKGYVRLQDGEALSTSSFDVAGESVQRGLKGFIYGERGVWRPGDSLFITFVLFDRDRALPPEHPVRFTLANARGQNVVTLTRTQSAHGFYAFRIPTDPDAPTGNWKACVKVGGVTFEKVLKVEAIMPNRLKIRFDLPPGATYLADGPMNATLSAAWLHGATASGLNADVEVSFAAGATRFAAYSEFAFDDPVREYEPESKTVFDGALDKNGTAMVGATLKTENVSPGMLTASFRTRVFEPGGAFSVDRFSIPYHPYKRYVGLRLPRGDQARGMLLTDTAHPAEIVLVDRDGRPQHGSVEVQLYKVEWRWWWEKGDESLADYVESKSHRPIECDTVNVVNGKAVWPFKVKYPEWGRFLVRARDLTGGHATGRLVYIDWPGWAGRGRKEMGGAASVLTFAADKSEYAVGETVTLTIPTSKEGRGLVSLESGTRVLQAEWFDPAGQDMTRYTFKATPSMAPTIYAHVTFVQPHQQTANDLPIRLYGVVPIKVVDPASRLAPTLDCAETFAPEQQAHVTVTEKSGKAMTYTLAIVDEGLLDLTRFQTPDPWEHFFAREALGVKTWDIYDQVMGAYAGSLERLLAIGGDEEAGEKGAKKAQRFPPMVRFYGPFDLERGRKGNHTIDIPQYVGAVRVMVVAGRDGAFGRTDKSVFVRKPLMVLGTLPRVLGPGEQVALPVSVFAMEEKVKNVAVSVRTQGPLAVSGGSTQKVSFSRPGDEVVTFTLTAREELGVAKVFIEAEGAGEKAAQTIEIDVRAPGFRIADVTDTTLDPSASWSRTITLPGIAGTNEVSLEVSRVLPMNLGKRLSWLIHYPYGCVEQTTSSVFPQIYLPKLVNLPADRVKSVQNNVNAGIDRLRLFQTSEGGFCYWPGDPTPEQWPSTYAGHFLVEAERAGYVVPAGMLDQWKKYQRNRAVNWTANRDQDALSQAYRLYTLALAGAAEIGAMNRLRDERKLPSAALWHLAAAYQLAGQKEAGEAIARKADVSVKKYRELGGTYGSDVRDKAMILEALCLLGMTERALPVAREISKALCAQDFLSTQSTSYALIALARHAGLDKGGQMSFTYTWQGGTEQTVTSAAAVAQVPLAIAPDKPCALTIRNTSSMIVFPRLVAEGIPAPGQEKDAANGMKISVSYLSTGDSRLDVESIEQGTDFVAEVTVRNTGSAGLYEEVALAQLVASGWEIRNARFEGTEAKKSSPFEYQDIRDDRIYTYFDIKQGESLTFRVMLNAAYLGRYYLPMQSVAAMYDETLNAREAGKWVKVVKPGE